MRTYTITCDVCKAPIVDTDNDCSCQLTGHVIVYWNLGDLCQACREDLIDLVDRWRREGGRLPRRNP
jgi:hypothetical protein